LGNVIIDEGENETTFVKESDKSFSTFCSLLKIDANRMRTWLCNKRIKTGAEVVNTTLNLNQVFVFLIFIIMRRFYKLIYRLYSLEMLLQNIFIHNYLDGLLMK